MKLDQQHLDKISKDTKRTAKRILQASYHGSSLVSHGRYASFIDAVLSKESGRKRAERRNVNLKLRKYFSSEDNRGALSPSEINKIIRAHECTKPINSGLISQICFNELASNKPIEDQTFVVQPNYNGGLLIGVIDGHGGAMFAETVKQRLPLYVSAAIANDEALSVLGGSFDPAFLSQVILPTSADTDDNAKNQLWYAKLESYLRETLDTQKEHDAENTVLDLVKSPLRQILGTSIMGAYPDSDTVKDITDCLKEAFLRLDRDITNEVIELSTKGLLNKQNVGLATSGCCALVAYIKGEDLHLANCGDCRAVLGNYGNNGWSAVTLTHDHTVGESIEMLLTILVC